MDPVGLEDLMIIGTHVTLVVDLDQDVPVSALEQPAHDIVHRSYNGCLIPEMLVLSKVKQTQEDDHAEVVGFAQDLFQPVEVIRTKPAVGIKG